MKNSFKIGLILFISILNLNCTNNKQSKAQSESGKITVISPSEFKENSINQTVVDVRTPEEFTEGHIKGALNINFKDETFLELITKLDKSKPVFVYCRSGKRSGAAAQEMSKAGFKQVYDLKGGIINWTQSNNETVK